MKVGVVGASGYTGGELLRLLAGHPECEVTCITSRKFAGKKVAEVHPNLRGILKIKFEDLAPERVASRCDFVFTATPHGASMSTIPFFVGSGIKAVDLSGDFRFKDVKTYERYYKLKHSCPGIKAVFGLPELHRKEIKKARLVANPGCYATCVILGLAPLVRQNLTDTIAADAKSGISGAGAEPTHKTHYPLTAESVLPYSVAAHRHLPEVEQELRGLNKKVNISFVPHLVPVIRGISATMHCFLRRSINGERIRTLYYKFYKNEPFVRILNAGEMPRMSAVRGSNYIDIGCFEVDEERKRAIIVVALDNLVKGAAGQAVQNMNIMSGFEETAGLKYVALYP